MLLVGVSFNSEKVWSVLKDDDPEVVEKRSYYDGIEEIIEDTVEIPCGLYIHKNYTRGETPNYIVGEMIYDNGALKFSDFIHEITETKDRVSRLLNEIGLHHNISDILVTPCSHKWYHN